MGAMANSWNIHQMRESMDFRRQLLDDQMMRNIRIKEAQDNFADLKDQLKYIDPDGFDAWYDDDNNIPNTLDWKNIQPVLDTLAARIRELGHQPNTGA